MTRELCAHGFGVSISQDHSALLQGIGAPYQDKQPDRTLRTL